MNQLASDTDLRILRGKAHRVFDQLWQDGLMTRDEAYLWIQLKYLLSPIDAHISRMGARQLNRLMADAAILYIKLQDQKQRRKERQDAKRHKRIRREQEAATRGPNPNRKR
jgi:hypothetical protein